MKNLLLFQCLLLVLQPAFVYGQDWEKTYGTGVGYSVQQTTDGGYVVIGQNGIHDICLLKTDNNGDTIWSKTFGGNTYDIGYSGQQTIDDGYIITGWTNAGSNQDDIFLIKTDSNGDTMWTKTYGGNDNEVGLCVQQTSDEGYIISGWNDSNNNLHDVYLIKTDSYGEITWTKTIIGDRFEVGRSVQQTTDGGYIITGLEAIMGSGFSNVYLIKTDSIGDVLWTKTFGGIDEDSGQSVQQTTDGGYIITGYIEESNNTKNVYLVKTDSNGDSLWTKTFGGSNDDSGQSVKQTTDGGYIITGATKSFSNSSDVYLIKTDENGNELWSRTFGGSDDDYGISVYQTIDGGYVITGTYSGSLVYLIKTDGNGIVSTSEILVPHPDKKLIKMVDLSGRIITNPQKNTPYIEIYNDGTTQKKMKLK